MTVSYALVGLDRRRYLISPEGVTDVERWQTEPDDPGPLLQTALFTRVMLALMSGRSAESYLEDQRQRHLKVMRDLTAARRTASLRDALLIDYQLFHVEADLRWIDHAIARVDTLGTAAAEVQL